MNSLDIGTVARAFPLEKSNPLSHLTVFSWKEGSLEAQGCGTPGIASGRTFGIYAGNSDLCSLAARSFGSALFRVCMQPCCGELFGSDEANEIGYRYRLSNIQLSSEPPHLELSQSELTNDI